MLDKARILWQVHIDSPIVSPNRRECWAVVWNRNKKYKREITNRWLLAPPPVRLPCIVVLTRYSSRQLDYDNLVAGFKGVRDGVADLLLPGLKPGIADSSKNIFWHYEQEPGKMGFSVTILEYYQD